MFDSTEELLEKIRGGEDTSLELKTVRFRGGRLEEPRRDDLADELAAIANTHDGVLVLGVDDKTREIVGIPVEHLDTVERCIYEICNDSIDPPLPFRAFRLLLPDGAGGRRDVLKVEISRSLFVHSNSGRYFYRQGSSKRKMPPEYLARLFQQRSQARLIRFEEQPVPQSGASDLSEKLWANYITPSDETADVVLLKRGLLAKEEGGTVCASVAGVLCCCEAPERFLSRAYIEAVRYRGKRQDSNYQMDAQRIYGPLPRQIEQAMAFLKRNQTVAAVKIPHRVEKPQFSEWAVFEALVNAVAHRDYSVSGSKIRFFMFDDRLEIYSPGALANTLTVDNMALRQSTRNELIASLLAKTSVAETVGDVGRRFYMEERGDGVPAILRESEKLSGRKPVYRLIDDAELLLTIYAANTQLKQAVQSVWEIEGARTKKFQLYEAACLLAGESPKWPLASFKAEEEYESLCRAVREDKFGDESAYEIGFLQGAHREHTLEIDRKLLRKYLKTIGRLIPAFLREEYDDAE